MDPFDKRGIVFGSIQTSSQASKEWEIKYLRERFLKLSVELHFIKEPLNEFVKNFTMRERECQYLKDKISFLNVKDLITSFRSSYVDAVKNNWRHESPIIVENINKNVFKERPRH